MSEAGTDAERLADIVRAQIGSLEAPVGIVLGTGLGPVAQCVAEPRAVQYAQLPGFPAAGVDGHAGRLIAGRIGRRDVIVLQGRAHYFEHGVADAMKAPIRTLRALGCTTVLLTNAAGSLRREAAPGSVMLIRDHINLTGVSPLFGETGSTRFVDMVDAYDPGLCARLSELARTLGIALHQGVYAWVCGPNFETPAEIRAVRRLGADAVGMSTVPEVIMARYAGMRVAALSILTNYAAGMDVERLSHEGVMAHAAAATDDVERLLRAFLD